MDYATIQYQLGYIKANLTQEQLFDMDIYNRIHPKSS